jgi:23S rRNA (uridine2552-2'-O)-methyltransferase
VRKVQDYYFKKAKKEHYPARSVYKLEEAQKKYRFLKTGDTVLDLGCQPGSWAIYAARTVGPEGLVVGVDLQEGQKISIAKAAKTVWLCQDIMAEDVVGTIQEISKNFRIILSDIAPRTSGNKWVDQQQSLNLARRVLELAESLLENGGNLYVKVFEGEDFKEFVDSVRKNFKTVKIIKPKSSRSESREVFILGLEFIKNKGLGVEDPKSQGKTAVHPED